MRIGRVLRLKGHAVVGLAHVILSSPYCCCSSMLLEWLISDEVSLLVSIASHLPKCQHLVLVWNEITLAAGLRSLNLVELWIVSCTVATLCYLLHDLWVAFGLLLVRLLGCDDDIWGWHVAFVCTALWMVPTRLHARFVSDRFVVDYIALFDYCRRRSLMHHGLIRSRFWLGSLTFYRCCHLNLIIPWIGVCDVWVVDLLPLGLEESIIAWQVPYMRLVCLCWLISRVLRVVVSCLLILVGLSCIASTNSCIDLLLELLC